ncbi:MAG: nucleotidyltransferase family protein [Anaerolineae bacterium]
MSAPPGERASGAECGLLPALIERLRTMLPELSERYGVAGLAVFGSYVREEQTSASDLDVLVEFEAPISLYRQVELEDLLSQRLGVKVDLVPRRALRPRVGERVLREAVPV